MFWNKRGKSKPDAQDIQAGDDPPAFSNIKVVIKTDLGNVRTNNEDTASSIRVANNDADVEAQYLLIVADGMGGHLAGEVASKMAVDIISEEYSKQATAPNKEKILAQAFTEANKRIFQLASSNAQYCGMGTTCTGLAIAGQTIYYAHAGDSRAYLYKDKSLTRITEDHTYVQELVKNGDIEPAKADTHPQRNILTNAMGTKPGLRVDTGKCDVIFESQDRVMLCSDGLYDYLSDQEIAAIMAYQSMQDAAEYFIAEAKRRGGLDNITVVMAEIEAVLKEDAIRLTREIDIPKITRDADLPTNFTNI